MAKGKFNKLDNPLKSGGQLDGQIEWDAYNYRDKFSYLCQIQGDAKNEKVFAVDGDKEDMGRPCVYVLVIDGKVFKIGSALRGMRTRIGSYNTGKIRYRIKGTNSGANYWVLHSILEMNMPVHVYALYPNMRKCRIFGKVLHEPFPSAKAIEGVLIYRFEEDYGKKPLGCVQR